MTVRPINVNLDTKKLQEIVKNVNFSTLLFKVNILNENSSIDDQVIVGKMDPDF